MLKSIILFLVVSLLGCSRAACPPTGDLVMPHAGDPTKYVVCREGMELILGCDDGTAYNPLTKKCESSRYWSERAPTCLYNQTETTYFPHETSCSMFYSCAYGVTNLETCPEGLEYNQDIWSCDWPSPNGCFAHTTAPPPTESTTESEPEPTTESVTVTEATEATEATTEITSDSPTDSTPIDPPEKCPANGTVVTLIPHPTDCTKFYICWNGTATVRECQIDWEFDSSVGGCVLISDSGCTASKTSTTIVPTQPTTEDPPCTGPGISHMPHPTNCNIYFICFDGILKYMGICNPGYEFDIEIKGCAVISDSGCTKTSTTEIADVTPTEPTPMDPSVKCELNGTEITLIPHPTICARYYVCWAGITTMLECFTDYEFDPEVGKCVLISSTGCTASKRSSLVWSTSTEGSSSITDEPDSKALVDTKSARNKLFSKIRSRSKREIMESKYQKALFWTCPNNKPSISVYPHEEECAVFYVCFGGTATAHFCENGFEFDANIQGCSRISANGCTVSKTTLPPPTTSEPPVFSCPSDNHVSITVFPDRRNCGKFHVCFRGVASTLFCDPGYEFSEKYLICVVSNSNCNADGTTSQWTTYTTTSDPTYYPSTTEDPWYTTTSDPTYYPSTTEDPWYTTTSDPTYYPSTTEDPWYTTTSDPTYYPSTTKDPWETTTSDPTYYPSTTEDPWYTTTSDPTYYPSTTKDPWETTTSDPTYYPSTTEDPWYTTTSDPTYYPSTTKDPWETTTSDPTYYPSTTEDPWYTTTSDPTYYPSTTKDPWETTTSDPTYYPSTTEDPWYTTTSDPTYYPSTTKDPWETTTSDPTYYPSTTEDPWYTTTSDPTYYPSTTKDPWETTTSDPTYYPSTTEDPWYTTTSDPTYYPSTTKDPWETTTSDPTYYPSTTEDPWYTTTSDPTYYPSTTKDPWETTTSDPTYYPSTTEDPWYTTTSDPTYYPSTTKDPWETTTSDPTDDPSTQ